MMKHADAGCSPVAVTGGGSDDLPETAVWEGEGAEQKNALAAEWERAGTGDGTEHRRVPSADPVTTFASATASAALPRVCTVVLLLLLLPPPPQTTLSVPM